MTKIRLYVRIIGENVTREQSTRVMEGLNWWRRYTPLSDIQSHAINRDSPCPDGANFPDDWDKYPYLKGHLSIYLEPVRPLLNGEVKVGVARSNRIVLFEGAHPRWVAHEAGHSFGGRALAHKTAAGDPANIMFKNGRQADSPEWPGYRITLDQSEDMAPIMDGRSYVEFF